MDKPVDSHIALDEDLAPPPQSKFSVVLNGIGNGMMLGAVPFVAMELYSQLSGKALSPNARKGSVFATIAGCALGAAYGIHEARSLEGYRQKLGQEITRLSNKVKKLEANQTSFSEREDARREMPAEEAPAR